MRSKEEAHDYRYFPDPDLLPVVFENGWVEQIKSELPELPMARAARFQKDFGLPKYDAFVLVQEKGVANYYEEVVSHCKNPKAASNWIMVELMRELKDKEAGIETCPISARQLAKLIQLIDNNTISGKIAKAVFADMWATQKDPEQIVKEKNLVQITDTGAIEKVIDEIIAKNASQVAEYRSGKDKLFGFFVGQAMKATKGQASPELVNQLLIKKLKG
jgi:aspartyl-tRNA(Asn)/glutamyl-tRNA(Gln) amidotransferase subunit B